AQASARSCEARRGAGAPVLVTQASARSWEARRSVGGWFCTQTSARVCETRRSGVSVTQVSTTSWLDRRSVMLDGHLLAGLEGGQGGERPGGARIGVHGIDAREVGVGRGDGGVGAEDFGGARLDPKLPLAGTGVGFADVDLRDDADDGEGGHGEPIDGVEVFGV